MVFKSFLIGSLALSTMLCGQTRFELPLKGKVFLTGNYGEIRPNHFHAGLDFRTDAKEHLPIYAVADGYVSRIKVGTHGYGKVLYITHPGGLVSVYGHQYAFNDSIKKYVRAAQDMLETFEIELFPKKDELKVKKGEIIGYTGNTGDSGGPHLHFEIRDEKSEVPLNPLRFVEILDTVAPTINSLMVYSSGNENPQLISLTGKADTFFVPMKFALAVSCFDLEQKNGNKNNVYRTEIFFDDTLVYRHILDSIAFDVASYVNAFCIIGGNGIVYQKCFVGKNNDLPIYKIISDHGFMLLSDSLCHAVKIKVYDFFNQCDEVRLMVKRKSNKIKESISDGSIDCLQPYKKETADYRILLQAKSLYEDMPILDRWYTDTLLKNENRGPRLLFWSPTGQAITFPFQKKGTLSIKTPETLLVYGDKLCIVEVTGYNKRYVGGTLADGFVTTNFKNFGTYKVYLDTIAPKVRYEHHRKTICYPGDIISFKATDDLSGIDKFKLYLNDKYYYAEYEHKTNTIFFEVTDKTLKGKIEVRLEVSDKKNNKTTRVQTFTFE